MWQPTTVSASGSETTGRYLVLLHDEAREAGIRMLEDSTGVEMVSAAAFAGAAPGAEGLRESRGVVLDTLGVAVVDAPPASLQSLAASADPSAGVLSVEPERVVYALDAPGGTLPDEYLRGYRDAVVNLATAAGLSPAPGAAAEAAATAFDESRLTWGLQATGIDATRFSGKGIKVAVLDTGFDLEHPDFAGRAVTTQSFVTGQTVHDVVGHGTHCIGTACGPREPSVLPRYGIAYDAEIFVGKVLNDQGRGVDGDILAGIEWALSSGCQVVSMSLGARTQPGQAPSPVFERAASRALSAGTLIVAAAGNDSQRQLGQIAPVSHPANCPSILAVAALDPSLGVSFFSNGGATGGGGQIDVAAPGRDVRSSWPMPREYNTISGTSMATPHVAGIAALAAEADAANRGQALWTWLQGHARRLPAFSTDVGAGLVQAP